jgi:hypothetical protein
MKDLIHVNISPEDWDKVNLAIKTIEDILLPQLVNLGPEDKQILPKMGDKTMAFVTKGIMHMEQNPDLVPKFTNVDDIKIDLEAVKLLRAVQAPLNKISDMVNDSVMLSGSEGLLGILSFYNNLKGAAKSNVPGADVIYNDLKARFTYRKKPKSDKSTDD